MDTKLYYRKRREVEASIPGKDAVIVSLETPDGGRAGVVMEVPKELAGKMVVEGKARLATEAEGAEYHEKAAAERRAIEQASVVNRVQYTILPEAELRALRQASRPGKQ